MIPCKENCKLERLCSELERMGFDRECAYKRKSGECEYFSEVTYRDFCHEGPCSHYKPQTNADRIRGMTDEELAEFIGTHDCLDCPLNSEEKWCAGNAGSCKGNVLGWLKAPVEVDNGT